MKRGSMTVVVVGLVLVTITGVSAHHSFNEFYLENESISFEGQVVEFEYMNPHAVLHVAVEGDDEQSVEYAAEWANPNVLRRSGVTPDTLQPGDYVIVTGSPGRNPEDNTLHLKGIERPSDDWEWAGRQGRGGGRGRRTR
jgi:hypothetical protein